MRRALLSILIVVLVVGGMAGVASAQKGYKAADDFLAASAEADWAALRYFMLKRFNTILPHWDQVVYNPPSWRDTKTAFISNRAPAANDPMELRRFMNSMRRDRAEAREMFKAGKIWLIPPGGQYKQSKPTLEPEILVENLKTGQAIYIPRWAIYKTPPR